MNARCILAVAVLTALACGREGGRGHAFPIPGDGIAVEVLNASGRDGLARKGTRVLRRAGIDVVYYGNAPAGVGTLDSTRILVRRGLHVNVYDAYQSIIRGGHIFLTLRTSDQPVLSHGDKQSAAFGKIGTGNFN